MTLPPELFYTGIVAQAYAPLRSETPDPRIYAGFVRRSGEPALELGCGDGDPLLDLVASGLDVEGLDSSPDMLARCRAAAAARGLDVVLHEQPMQAMDLGRRYRSIYIAGPTFNLLPDDDVALQALRRIRAHLEPGGAALIPLFVPAPTPPEALGRTRSHTTDDGTILRVTAVAEDRDEGARLHITTLRYEVEAAGETTVDERPWLIHWYAQSDFAALAQAAGLTVDRILAPDGSPAAPDAPTCAFSLTPT
jgi:Methyltransferase domain